MQIKEKYEEMIQELESMQSEYTILEQEYKKQDKHLLETEDKINNLDDEITIIKNNLEKDFEQYVLKKSSRISIVVFTIVALIAATFGKIPILNAVNVILNILNIILSFFIYGIVVGTTLIPILGSPKVVELFDNKYRKTKNYTQIKEIIKNKEKNKEELKKQTISLGSSLYELHRKVSNFKKQTDAKQKEIEEFKNEALDFFFTDIKEENKMYENEKKAPCYDEVEEKSTPLVKTRRMDN